MKLCKGCNIEYENFATYCNDCNLDLDDDNSVSKPRALNDNTKLVLAIAKNTKRGYLTVGSQLAGVIH
jgi:predicted amidophosphoribosyltransferase